MANIVEIVRDSLEAKSVSPKVLEKTPVYVKRAIIKLQNKGVLPPKIWEFTASDKKEERRDGNGNLMHNFVFLPTDFARLDRFVIHNKTPQDNQEEKPYQYVSNDSFYNRRLDSDDRNFFTIMDYNIDDEQSRKILIADPFPADDDYLEVRYFVDGTEDKLERFNDGKYWEPIITQVEAMLGLASRQDAEEASLEESSDWRNQKGQNSYNKTFTKTKVRFPFGK